LFNATLIRERTQHVARTGYVRIFAASGTANCAAIASPTAGCENNPLPDKAATP
jgi:hypothetical protein